MTLKYCTTYQGVPFGPALIKFNHENFKGLSFEALGIFNNGILNGPCLCIKSSQGNETKLFTLMINGRPSDDHFSTYFFQSGLKCNVESLDFRT